jgi:hypothetical protein
MIGDGFIGVDVRSLIICSNHFDSNCMKGWTNFMTYPGKCFVSTSVSRIYTCLDFLGVMMDYVGFCRCL